MQVRGGSGTQDGTAPPGLVLSSLVPTVEPLCPRDRETMRCNYLLYTGHRFDQAILNQPQKHWRSFNKPCPNSYNTCFYIKSNRTSETRGKKGESLCIVTLGKWVIFPTYGENHSVLSFNLLMSSVIFIDFVPSNPASIPAVSALYTYGLSFYIYCQIPFANILFKGY